MQKLCMQIAQTQVDSCTQTNINTCTQFYANKLRIDSLYTGKLDMQPYDGNKEDTT